VDGIGRNKGGAAVSAERKADAFGRMLRGSQAANAERTSLLLGGGIA
jgi:hypothetical protein